MNILYIDHYAGSPEMGMEFRPYYFAREWIRMGYNVRIAAGDYSHLRLINPKAEHDFKEEVIDGITYSWVKTGEYEGNGVSRAMTMFRFVYKLWKRAKWIADNWKPDVIITSSTYPLDTYAGQRIKKFTKNIEIRNGEGAVLIHEVHDMWPITLTEIGGMKKSNPFVMLMQIAENSFCVNSDHIVSLPCAARDYFIEHGMAPEKFNVVMNGVLISEWEKPTELPKEHKELLNDLHDKGRFVIGFFGSVNISYAVGHLIKAQQKLDDDRIAVVIVGEGSYKEELKRIAGKNVYFLPKISKKAIPSLVKNFDCCYVGALRNDMFRFGICMNKLFDSMMSGRPILYAVEAPNNFIDDYRCGISVKAEDVDSLADGIKKMIETDRSTRAKMGRNGRNAVIEHFSYERLAEGFAELFLK